MRVLTLVGYVTTTRMTRWARWAWVTFPRGRRGGRRRAFRAVWAFPPPAMSDFKLHTLVTHVKIAGKAIISISTRIFRLHHHPRRKMMTPAIFALKLFPHLTGDESQSAVTFRTSRLWRLESAEETLFRTVDPAVIFPVVQWYVLEAKEADVGLGLLVVLVGAFLAVLRVEHPSPHAEAKAAYCQGRCQTGYEYWNFKDRLGTKLKNTTSRKCTVK